MFKDSCDEVKKRLTQMCRHVEENMNNRTDEVFILMRRDYLTVINGAQVKGDIMPKWERHMRANVAQALEEHEKDEAQALGIADEAGEDSDTKTETPGKEEEDGEDAKIEETTKEEDETKEDTTENSGNGKGKDTKDTTMEVDKPDVPTKENVANTESNETSDANPADTVPNNVSSEAELSELGSTPLSSNSNNDATMAVELDESTEDATPTPTPSCTESATSSGASSPES
jgi:hypothetical protein